MAEDMDAIRRQLAISCADALELMTDHLEGALVGRRRGADAGAPRWLRGCKVYLDQLRATIGIVREAGPPEEFRSIRQRVDALVDLFRSERLE